MAISIFLLYEAGVYTRKMFITLDMEDTRGISEIGISFAIVFLASFLVRMIDFDSFLDGVSGIDDVVDVSMKI